MQGREPTSQNGRSALPAPKPSIPELDRSIVLETPAQNYFLSETRLLSHLLKRASDEFGIELRQALANPAVQQVLSHDRITAVLPNNPDSSAALRYIAHIYNATLGTDFLVHESAQQLRFYSDGALRRALEDLQERGQLPIPSPARQWSEGGLSHFLSRMPEERPGLDRFLEKAQPEERLLVFPASMVRTQPLYVQEIVVPTANRPNDVRRLLRSLERNFEFYGYPKGSISIRIFDTSTSPGLRHETRKNVEDAKHRGLHVKYSGPSDIRSELKKIRDALPSQAQRAFAALFLRGLFSRSGNEGLPATIGTIRNAIALIMGDRPYLSLDDDMMLDAPIPRQPDFEARRLKVRERAVGYDLHVGAAVDFVRFDTAPSAIKKEDFVWIPTDILGIANRRLDTPLYVVESRVVGDVTDSPFAGGEPRVAVVRPYLAGASPDVTLFLRRFISSQNVGELTGKNADYHLPIECPGSVFHRGYSSGTMFATSAGLSAPFMDARAYEDVAQSQVTEYLFRNNLQYQGGVVEHRRHVGPRIIGSDQYIDVLLGYHLLHRYLSIVHPGSTLNETLLRAPNRVQALRKLGQKLWTEASGRSLSTGELSNLIDGYLGMGRALRACKVDGADSFMTNREQIAVAIETRRRVLQRANGLLYFYWPDFVAAATKVSDL